MPPHIVQAHAQLQVQVQVESEGIADMIREIVTHDILGLGAMALMFVTVLFV